MRPTPVQCDPWTAVFQVVDRLEKRWLGDSKVPGDGDTCYGYCPLPLTAFFAGMDRIGTANGRKLINLGCGIGTKMLLAFWLGWDVTGVEFHAPYVAAARELCPEADVYESDAMAFTDMGEYDVIYSYRLFVSDDDQRALEEHIATHAKPGTYLFSPQGIGVGESLGADVWRLG